MDEMQVEAAHCAQGEEMIVPLLGRGRSNADFLRPGTAGGNKPARPAQRLERLVPRAGARFGVNFRGFPWHLDNRNAEVVYPGRDVARTRDPLHLGFGGKRREERPPDRGHFGAAKDRDPAE